MHRYLTLSLLLSVMVLNACGTRGPLYLPPPAAQPPGADSPAVPPGSGAAVPADS